MKMIADPLGVSCFNLVDQRRNALLKSPMTRKPYAKAEYMVVLCNP
jgi:hypothetical protein